MSNHTITKITKPIQRFIQNEKSGGIVLAISVVLALIIANSPLVHIYHETLNSKFGFVFKGANYFELSLHHWINDGLMAIFFFVVGLELKREIVGGELSNPKKAMLPIVAAIGGMLVPALIYLGFNHTGEVQSGWGIPMATDIAFALGVLYLLGDKVPTNLKIFLTALAIVDDLGAVLVIALFYTSDISILNLGIGLGLVLLMLIANKMGVRNVIFYAVVGILGVWVAFLLSGVHATIAAVLAAFTIPSNVKIKEQKYINQIQGHLNNFEKIDPLDEIPTLSSEQLNILEQIQKDTHKAMPPIQRLEHALHPFVTFVIIPIFAFTNSGISLNLDFSTLFETNVAIGVGLGLLIGKVIGIVGFTLLFIKLKIADWPVGMTLKNLFGLGLLAAIGFTMSLFVTELAFDNELLKTQAKIGIFMASILGGVLGYNLLKNTNK